MLIYNYKKEFLGIDEANLKALGLKDLADLRAESADFADLFVKTPGCIHNFKHVHWIDYVLDDSGAESKAVIHVKDKNFSTNINIKTIYLVDNPDTKAYLVELANLRTLSGSQIDKFSSDISQKQPTQGTAEKTELFTTPGSVVHDQTTAPRESKVEQESKVEKVTYDPYESDDYSSITTKDMYETPTPVEEDFAVDETPLKIDLEEPQPEALQVEEQKVEKVERVPTQFPTKEELPESTDDKFANYVYDPHFASEELGLPIDLIQEFIQDFITQADSFKDELYQSTIDQDLNTLKIQSHKLKGVAANLRILDALDALTTINTSEDYAEIKTNLDNFYVMISKLSGTPLSSAPVVEEALEEEEEELILSFKEDPAPVSKPSQESNDGDFATDVILDSDVPTNISIPELADDEFLNSQDAEESSNLEIDPDDMSESLEDLQADDPADEEETYDKSQIAHDFGLDIDSFNELFGDFIGESNELAETIIQSADENNLAVCKTLATKMKGMSDNMRIHKFDSELEDIINASSTQSVKDSIALVKTKLNKISTSEEQ